MQHGTSAVDIHGMVVCAYNLHRQCRVYSTRGPMSNVIFAWLVCAQRIAQVCIWRMADMRWAHSNVISVNFVLDTRAEMWYYEGKMGEP